MASRWLTMLLATLLVPMASAQAADAPHVSVKDFVLYAHHNAADTVEAAGWMNTLIADPDSDDIALGPSGTFGPTRTWTFTLTPGLTQEVTLDKTKPAILSAFLGAGSGQGIARVTSQLKIGATVIVNGAEQNHIYQASTAQYGKLTWSINPTVDKLAAGQPLVWTVSATGAGSALFMGVHPDRGKSNISLPVLAPAGGAPIPPAPAIIFHDETGTQVGASISSVQRTNASHQYNWTNLEPVIDFSFEANVSGGSVAYTILDGANVSLAAETLDENKTGNQRFSERATGNWTIRVNLTDFSGDFTFRLAPAVADPTPATSQGPTPTTTGASPTETSPTSDEATPAPGALLVVAALVATLLAMRRRSLRQGNH
jgi:hypothetical protein